MIRSMRTLTRITFLGLALLVATAAPAAADNARPGDYESEVTGITPAVDGVTATVEGGDAFIGLSVDPGHEVVVAGYQGEPYLRFLDDGTVQRNALSQATYLNEDRQGGGEIPPAASDYSTAFLEGEPTAEPEWVDIATGGSYAWHDHRTHWMQEASPSVARGEYVDGAYDPWRIPLEVDGTEATVEGRLLYAETTSPLPWIALAVAAAIVLGVVGRRAPVPVAAGALLVVSLAGLVSGRAEWSATPGGGNPLLWVLPAVAAVLAAVGLAFARRAAGSVAVLAAVALLSGWALLRFSVLTKPILPTSLPPAFDRATVALALGTSLAAAYLVVTGGTLALPALDDDEPRTPATSG